MGQTIIPLQNLIARTKTGGFVQIMFSTIDLKWRVHPINTSPGSQTPLNDLCGYSKLDAFLNIFAIMRDYQAL